MRVLGLDLSLTSTGYVLLGETGNVVWQGAVGSNKLRDVERLAMFDSWLRDYVHLKAGSVNGWPVDAVGIEGYSYASANGLAQQGELGGIVRLAFHQAQIPIHIIPPSTWKKVLCGKGNLQKDLVRIELFKRYNVEFASQDTLDAWAVAMCLRRQLLGLDRPEPKSRKRKVPVGLPLLESTGASA
jgi:crossover junction endodeoxyribonuclease RuvC